MKYNQPFDQPSSPNAPYVDGNPAAGVQGSIVPAAAVEYPQRELTNLFLAAGLSPNNSDLGQLVKALKIADVFNAFKAGTNQGSATQWSTSIPALPAMPPPPGTAIWVRPGYPSVNGGTVFSVNGSPFLPVILPDLSPIQLGDILATGWVLLFLDGASNSWQVVAGAVTRAGGGGNSGLPPLQANATWYVNDATGDDTNHDGTAAVLVAATKHGPFKTIQRAVAETLKYNMNGYNQTIIVADGNYVGPVVLPTPNGAGLIFVQGNNSNPGNCRISCTQANDSAVENNGTGVWHLSGFRLSSAGASVLDGLTVNSGTCVVYNLQFGPCARYHMCAAWGATLSFDSNQITIEAGANAAAHICSSYAAQVNYNPFAPPTIWNILGPVAFTHFIESLNLGVFSVTHGAINGGGNVSGARYYAQLNGVIETPAGGPNYWPGSAPGILTSGGQYL